MKSQTCIRNIGLISILLCICNGAWAQTVVFVPVEATGVEAAGRIVDSALRDGIARVKGLVEGSKVQMSLEEAKTSFSCFKESGECMAQVGELLAAEVLFWGHLKRTDSVWSLTLNRLDVKAKRVLRAESVIIPRGESEFDDLAHAATAFVLGNVIPDFQKIEVVITSTPTGINTLFDGRDVGLTPVTVRAKAGIHLVELQPLDLPVQTREIEVGTTPAQIAFDLAVVSKPLVTNKPVEPPKPVSSNALTYVGIGAGVVAVGAGIATAVYGLEVLSLETEINALEPETRDRYPGLKDDFESAKTSANIFAAITGVATVASIYLLVIHDDGGEAVTVSPGLGGVTVQGHF